MEFRNIETSEFESYIKFLDALNEVNGSIEKVAEVIYDGRKYLVADGVNAVGIAAADGDKIRPFFINLDDPIFQVCGNLDCIYNIVDSELKEVVKTDGDHSYETRVSYLPAVDNYPRCVIEYSQYLSEINSLLEFKYDVTTRKNLEMGLSYTYYQLPDHIRFNYLKKFGPFVHSKNLYYGRSLNENNVYYSPLFVIRDMPYGQKNKTFDGNILMHQFADQGFEKQIPSELSSLILGTNEGYNKLKLINNEYKKHIKGQN